MKIFRILLMVIINFLMSGFIVVYIFDYLNLIIWIPLWLLPTYFILTYLKLIKPFNFQKNNIVQNDKDSVPSNQKQTTKDINNLSLKYSILKAYKVFLILLMIGSTYYTIDWFVTYLDLPSMAQEALNSLIKYYIIGYISSIFSLYCLIKIIDFLFDLNSKIDN